MFFKYFVQFYNFVIVQFGVVIKCIQSDEGGEYLSRQFKNFLVSKGMVHQISCPYTPQHNGFVERRHRHIVETAITLLTAAGLSQSFWFHACAYAVYLINRLPTKSLHMDSPFSILYHKPPQLQHLRAFGIAIFPYLRPYNNKQLQPRSSLCIFLCYSVGYKGCICYNIQTHKLLISRHVVHDETIFPAIMMQCTPTQSSSGVSHSPVPSPIVVNLPISVP